MFVFLVCAPTWCFLRPGLSFLCTCVSVITGARQVRCGRKCTSSVHLRPVIVSFRLVFFLLDFYRLPATCLFCFPPLKRANHTAGSLFFPSYVIFTSARQSVTPHAITAASVFISLHNVAILSLLYARHYLRQRVCLRDNA